MHRYPSNWVQWTASGVNCIYSCVLFALINYRFFEGKKSILSKIVLLIPFSMCLPNVYYIVRGSINVFRIELKSSTTFYSFFITLNLSLILVPHNLVFYSILSFSHCFPSKVLHSLRRCEGPGEQHMSFLS